MSSHFIAINFFFFNWFNQTKLFEQFSILDLHKYKKPKVKIRTTNFYFIPFGKRNICSEWLCENSSSFSYIFVWIDLRFLFFCKKFYISPWIEGTKSSIFRYVKSWEGAYPQGWGVHFSGHTLLMLTYCSFILSWVKFFCFLTANFKNFRLRRAFWILLFLSQPVCLSPSTLDKFIWWPLNNQFYDNLTKYAKYALVRFVLWYWCEIQLLIMEQNGGYESNNNQSYSFKQLL